MDHSELDLHQWLRSRERSWHGASPALSVPIGLDDDMASLQWNAGHALLVSTDLLLDGTHFERPLHRLEQIGMKAARRALSDVAAMAAEPLALLVSLAIPNTENVFQTGKAILEAMSDVATQYRCPIVGGDTASWDHSLAIDVCALARQWPDLQPAQRSGARTGDLIYVTGKLGGSILGKHLNFSPRIEEAHQLAAALRNDLHAMIDISDGLTLDLYRVCEASGCGAELYEDQLAKIASEDAHRRAAQDNVSIIDCVCGDGEDYELLLAAAPEAARAVESLNFEIYLIGKMVDKGLRMIRTCGTTVELQPLGYVH